MMQWQRAVAMLGTAVLLGACGDAVVGGRCAGGYVARNGHCVVMGDGAPGDTAQGDGALDADAPDAPYDAMGDPRDYDAKVDGDDGVTDVTASEAGTDASDVVCGPGLTACGGLCVDTTMDPAHCGTCGGVCSAVNHCVAGVCVPLCSPPTLDCGGVCIDPQTDESNCGGCGVVCPSGVCNAGVCRNALVGHAVLIGHNYVNTRADPDRIVGNAVFLASAVAPRVLTYVGRADATAVTHVNAAVTSTGGARSWSHTALIDPTLVSTMLSIDRYDVMLVYEQTNATDTDIATLASSMGPALASFARAGGVVIVLDGPTHNGGTFPVMAATALLNPRGVRNVDAQLVSLAPGAGADALVVGVRTTYRATTTSVAFTDSDPGAVFQQGADPVVLHVAVGP